jgi:NAD(P)-dependent dehydrogenase (short-subunit alcohol dehydrogenase family)
MGTRLQNKTALVTGGATGIGQAIALALAGEGCRVAIAGRRADKLGEAASAWQSSPRIESHVCDVTDRTSVAALFEWANSTLGRIDILVNSAGVNTRQRMMSDITPEIWDEVLRINATGVFNCVHAVLPQMRQRQDGLIINVSSVAGKRASMLGGVAYCASKFAVSALSAAVALEEGGHGIRITNLIPGEVETPILKDRPVPPTPEHLARMLRPEDVGAAALMVACLPPRAHIAELLIKPTSQDYA